MATIVSENLKTLRPALNIFCGIDETSDKASEVDATNIKDLYEVNAKVTEILPQVLLMDLCNGGFYNDGTAQPATNYEIVNQNGKVVGKYGLIADTVTDTDGNIPSPVTLTITSEKQFDYLTLTYSDSKGNIETKMIDGVTWSGNTTTLTINTFIPNERLYILRVSLGKSWAFDTEDLISCNLNLRGVETTIDNPELQMSEIEIKAYEPEDYSNIIGHITAGAPIWYQSGYAGDMSDMRYFYLNSKIEYQQKVLTIKGYDATYFIEDQYNGKLIADNQGYIRQDFANAISDIVSDAGINAEYEGFPDIQEGITATASFFIPNQSKRLVISNAVNLYRKEGFCLTYVDAGNPKWYLRDPITTTWEIYADQVANFKTEIELDTTTAKAVLETAAVSSASEEIQQIDAVSGQSYFINTSEPYYSFTTSRGNIYMLSPFTARLDATATGTAIVSGRKINISATASNNPYTATKTGTGVTVALDNQPLITSYWGNDTIDGMDNLLRRSNVLYSFTYRGNPHIQPRDLINFHYADGTTELMTVDNLTLEHQNGGLQSDIVARRGVV